MKKTFLLQVFMSYSLFLSAQNIGVGTTTPAEKLDVNGNMNINGQLKVNSDSGKASQVLMKNASNNLVWGDLSAYQNIVSFDCGNTAGATGSSNCSQNFTVPTGVTRILVECWGGGGGGCSLTGGAGGGYITCILTVIPGNTITFTTGAGGSYGTSSSAGIGGGNTSFSYGGFNYTATGGLGGYFGNPFASNVTSVNVQNGGYFASTAPNNFTGFNGQPGGYSKFSFNQVSATEFAKVVQYGDGGDAALLPNSGTKGGYRLSSPTYQQEVYASQTAVLPGGGGGADYNYGWSGKGGRVIIHY